MHSLRFAIDPHGDPRFRRDAEEQLKKGHDFLVKACEEGTLVEGIQIIDGGCLIDREDFRQLAG
jgi:hypothetical protein